ncbi:MAG: STAS domain-containing protein [Bacteroidales bacterium]|nr:STAS domain-containing protein [Bacteroidales bacterium]MDD3859794.1 STAS domain-containing protein [Bacteroidales bacterium]HOZ29680.1 STAS domain-containing protein [Bacteroidales bacterium]
MDVRIKMEESLIVVIVEGSIDSNTSGELQTKIMGKISESNNVILDLSKVDFISSAGLRVLLMVYRQIKVKNGKVVLVGISEEIKDVMTMTGFINYFEMTETIEEANKLF